MWALISLPLIGVLCGFIIDQTRPGAFVVLALLLPVFTGPIWLALIDIRTNPQIVSRSTSGKGSLVMLALVFVPAYVWVRQRALDRPRWPAAVYIVVALLVLALIPDPGTDLVVDDQWLEAEIARSVIEQRGTSPQVECPDGEPLRVGHTFTCTMIDRGQGSPVRVEVVDDGYVQWTVG